MDIATGIVNVTIATVFTTFEPNHQALVILQCVVATWNRPNQPKLLFQTSFTSLSVIRTKVYYICQIFS